MQLVRSPKFGVSASLPLTERRIDILLRVDCRHDPYRLERQLRGQNRRQRRGVFYGVELQHAIVRVPHDRVHRVKRAHEREPRQTRGRIPGVVATPTDLDKF